MFVKSLPNPAWLFRGSVVSHVGCSSLYKQDQSAYKRIVTTRPLVVDITSFQRKSSFQHSCSPNEDVWKSEWSCLFEAIFQPFECRLKQMLLHIQMTTTQTATQRAVRSRLVEWLQRPQSRTTDDVEWVRHLLAKQEAWQSKTHKVTAVRSTLRRGCLYLQVKVDPCNRWCTVSWRASCGREKARLPPPALSKLTSAMRNSIRRQVSLWRSSHAGDRHCVRCNATTALQVDHVTPFVQIARSFAASGRADEPTSFDCRPCKGFYFRKSDVAYAKAFRAHHRMHATFQWLCKSCNCSKGSRVVDDGSSHVE